MAAEVPTAKDLTQLLSLLAPGLIILGIRQWFVAAPAPDFKERAIAYAGVSAVYYAVANPLFRGLAELQRVPGWGLSWAEYFFIPVILGTIYAFATYYEFGMWLWRRTGIQPVHAVLTSWDYAFKRLPPTCIAVTLNDGRILYGIYGPGSFTSSISAERDILISNLCSFNAGKWAFITPPRSILLFGRDIKSIELFRGPNG